MKHESPAAKVAAGATAVIAVVYVIGVIVLNLLVSSHLTGQNDSAWPTAWPLRDDPAELSQQAQPSAAARRDGG